jgi:hypothetical protein
MFVDPALYNEVQSQTTHGHLGIKAAEEVPPGYFGGCAIVNRKSSVVN